MIIKAQNNLKAEVGDSVVVGISSKTFFKASALIYILPVAALIAGGALGKWVARSFDIGISAEPISALAGLVSLGISFFVVRTVAARIGESKANQARVIKVL